MRDPFGLPLGFPLFPGSKGRPRCFRAVFSAGFEPGVASLSYVDRHVLVAIRSLKWLRCFGPITILVHKRLGTACTDSDLKKGI